MTEFRHETERLVLRDWRESDAQDFHRLHCDPQVMATLGPLRDMDYTTNLITDLQNRAKRNGGHTYWAVERKEDGRVIGFCGLDRGYEGTIVGELEIGWRLASDCWGAGYATEAAEACVSWARDHKPGERIVAITAETNTASRALMTRIGMEHCPALDFEHSHVAEGDPLRPHVVYVKEMN
ncbi:GNAT family N-acetyltransferase [Aurantiacibacter sp. D1-12]|uniref:GNAT family N-acetyltransferase n=1 Tax=Aurantiacibacter sp. D1-12 TaxID=2993658 RepID=UPI00237C55D6|nr:GNAT family N-acetyltransferase [Aurantiacibacter sp. D1-12]MDE1468153.1 GNAT family N-acetyltransferase [Aurantiacibacter sp. D1-12]